MNVNDDRNEGQMKAASHEGFLKHTRWKATLPFLIAILAASGAIGAGTNGYITALLASECGDAPQTPPPVGETAVGPDYVIMTVANGDPMDFQAAQQVATDQVFASLMPVYCALPRGTGIGCVADRVQWNIMVYDANGQWSLSVCAASGCGYHSCSVTMTNGPVLTNGPFKASFTNLITGINDLDPVYTSFAFPKFDATLGTLQNVELAFNFSGTVVGSATGVGRTPLGFFPSSVSHNVFFSFIDTTDNITIAEPVLQIAKGVPPDSINASIFFGPEFRSTDLSFSVTTGDPRFAAWKSGPGVIEGRLAVSFTDTAFVPALIFFPATDTGVYRGSVSVSYTYTPAVGPARRPGARLTARGRPNQEGFELTVTGEIGRTYRIQANSDLAGTNWVDLFTYQNTQGANTLFLDSNAGNLRQRFYRAVSP